jgi:hypothetical protein
MVDPAAAEVKKAETACYSRSDEFDPVSLDGPALNRSDPAKLRAAACPGQGSPGSCSPSQQGGDEVWLRRGRSLTPDVIRPRSRVTERPWIRPTRSAPPGYEGTALAAACRPQTFKIPVAAGRLAPPCLKPLVTEGDGSGPFGVNRCGHWLDGVITKWAAVLPVRRSGVVTLGLDSRSK